MASERLHVMHVQPMSLGLFGHRDEDLGTSLHYSVSRLAAAQASQGDKVEVHLVASGAPLSFRAQGVDFRFHRGAGPPHIGRRLGPFGREVSPGMLGAIRPGRADVVHFHGVRQFHLMYGAVAWRAARGGLPLIAQDRGGRGARRAEVWAQGVGLKRTRAVLAASRACVAELQDRGVLRGDIYLVPNGADPDVFFPAERRPPEPGAPLRLLYVARLVHDKDPMMMADAAVDLVSRGIPITVTVVSRGPLRGEVEARLREGDVPAVFIDYLPQADLAEEYRRADVVVLTSRLAGWNEGWNQVALEAMASGVPLVATDIPGIRDCVGGGGTLVPVEQPALLARALERLARSSEAWSEARSAAVARAAGFSWHEIASYVRGIYLESLPAQSTVASAVDPDHWIRA